MKICSKCKHTKDDSEFYKKVGDQKQSYCKICLLTVQKQRWIDRKVKAIKLKGGKCQICGYDKNHAALCFHHKDPTTKEFTWNKGRLRNWESALKELDKCILLCANCHAEIHYPRFTLV